MNQTLNIKRHLFFFLLILTCVYSQNALSGYNKSNSDHVWNFILALTNVKGKLSSDKIKLDDLTEEDRKYLLLNYFPIYDKAIKNQKRLNYLNQGADGQGDQKVEYLTDYFSKGGKQIYLKHLVDAYHVKLKNLATNEKERISERQDLTQEQKDVLYIKLSKSLFSLTTIVHKLAQKVSSGISGYVAQNYFGYKVNNILENAHNCLGNYSHQLFTDLENLYFFSNKNIVDKITAYQNITIAVENSSFSTTDMEFFKTQETVYYLIIQELLDNENTLFSNVYLAIDEFMSSSESEYDSSKKNLDSFFTGIINDESFPIEGQYFIKKTIDLIHMVLL